MAEFRLPSNRAGNAYYFTQLAKMDGQTGLASMSTVVARQVVSQMAESMNGEGREVMGIFAKAMASKMARNRDVRVTRIHQETALEAQRAVAGSYMERVGVGRKAGGSYRQNAPGKLKRYSAGAMLSAINDPGFFRAAWDGISFINTRILDRKAKQWYRLNFGAGGVGGSGQFQHRDYRLRFFGEALPNPLTLKGYTPSEGFYVPERGIGVFTDPGLTRFKNFDASRRGQDPFYPLSYFGKNGGAPPKAAGRRMSRGIEGFAFFDAGVGRMARLLPVAYTELMNEWFREASVRETGPVAFVVDPTTAGSYLDQIGKRLDAYAAATTKTNFLNTLQRSGRFVR